LVAGTTVAATATVAGGYAGTAIFGTGSYLAAAGSGALGGAADYIGWQFGARGSQLVFGSEGEVADFSPAQLAMSTAGGAVAGPVFHGAGQALRPVSNRIGAALGEAGSSLRNGARNAWNRLRGSSDEFAEPLALTAPTPPTVDASAASYSQGFINEFVDGTVAPDQLQRLRRIAEQFENENGVPLDILTGQVEDGYSQRLHSILLSADDSNVPRGTLAEEVQHAIDKAAGLFDDGRLANGLPKIKSRFGENYNAVWHAGVFDRIADSLESGTSVLNIFLDSSDASAFRNAANEIWRQLGLSGIFP
jgi:hypothetical protein